MTRYMMMPIGKTTVVLVYDDNQLLYAQRSKWDNRKLKLNLFWWTTAEVFHRNKLIPSIEANK